MPTLYERAFRRLGLADVEQSLGLSLDKDTTINAARRDLIGRYGFAIPTSRAITQIKKLGPVLEIGSGNGYWAHELRKAGADVVATDLRPDAGLNDYPFQKQWTLVEEFEAVEAVRTFGKGRVLLVVWPCYNESWAYRALKAYRETGGTTLVYVGEGQGGCTADESFFDELGAHWTQDGSKSEDLLSWPLIYDEMRVYRCS